MLSKEKNMTINRNDTRACIQQLETRVHALNHACIHNADITKILGLQHVPCHVGRLTHALLGTQKQRPVYRYSTLLLPIDENAIEENAYFARYYLGLIAKSVLDFVRDHPGCSQSTVSRECLGLNPTDYHDHNWIASQLLDLLQTHGVIVKRKHKIQKTCVRLTVNSTFGITKDIFRFGYANVREYIEKKNIGSRFEKQYVSHLLRNAKAWGIYRLEVQKTFPGLVGDHGKPLRTNLYIEQSCPEVKKCIEINSKESHDERKLAYMEQNGIILIHMNVSPREEAHHTLPP